MQVPPWSNGICNGKKVRALGQRKHSVLWAPSWRGLGDGYFGMKYPSPRYHLLHTVQSLEHQPTLLLLAQGLELHLRAQHRAKERFSPSTSAAFAAQGLIYK